MESLVLRAAGVTSAVAILCGCSSYDDGVGSTPQQLGRTRTYYIAAEDREWDYAPAGNVADPFFDAYAPTFIENVPYRSGGEVEDARIGSVYKKALYRAYRDEHFDTPAQADPAWAHLGALGPPIVAEVGDTVVVHFRNRSSITASIHAHGVLYEKDSEGAPYADGTGPQDRGDDAVPPGGEHVYTWLVPDRAGPADHEPSSVLWMYHSHTDEVADTYAGLIGPIVVTARGQALPDGSPKDVDRSFITLFHVYDENQSQYLAQNAARYANVTDHEELELLAGDEHFVESNLMHSINGYVYGNLPGLSMHVGERVRWYAIGMGTEIDIHTPHWHGGTVINHGARTDAITLLPGLMEVADMTPDMAGTWLYHCHINDHINAGMVAVFEVVP